jgi:arylsulfatase A-like enzyme
LLLATIGWSGCRPAAPQGGVVLVIVDTARADHFSSYGYPRPTTPGFDRLASEGVLYADAWSQSPWTLPAAATILTGLPPYVHGAGRTATGVHAVRPGLRTLAERLGEAGYRTAAFFNVIWCSPEMSELNRGFETYDFSSSDESNVGTRDARATTDAALAWLERIGDAPFLLVVHYFDPHLTYDPPAPYDTMFEPPGGPRIPPGFGSAEQVFEIRDHEIVLDARRKESLIARYDGELRFTDDQFGRLREALESSGRWDETLVVVVGDHGEEFWDHGGFEHGQSHYRELLRVPLIVRRPGGPSGRVREGRVRQLDIAPTVLDFAGLRVPDELPGRVLGQADARFAVAEGTLWDGDLVSVRADVGTLILDRTTGAEQFFSPDDPLEQQPFPAQTTGEPQLLPLLRAIPIDTGYDRPPRELTEEEVDRLRSLGYIQ